MCDFSLHAIKSRPAEVGDKLTTRQFPLSTTASLPRKISRLQYACVQGRSCPLRRRLGDVRGRGLRRLSITKPRSSGRSIGTSRTATTMPLEFPDGQILLLTLLQEGQHATVLQLPAGAAVGGAKATQEVAHV